MNDLEPWLGLDFSKYHLGDKLILKEGEVIKHGLFNNKYMVESLQQVAMKHGLWCTIMHNNCTSEYEIEFLEYKPEIHVVPRPDPKVSRARRI